MDSSDQYENSKLALPSSNHFDDEGRSTTTPLKLERHSAQLRPACQRPYNAHARQKRQNSQDQRSQNQHLSRSWSGFDNQDQHDKRLTKSIASKPDLSGYHANGIPPTDLDGELPKGDNCDVDACQPRLQRRLMTSVFVAILCYITSLLSLIPLQSQYLFQRYAADYFNLTNVTSEQTPCAEDGNDSLNDDLNIIQTMTSQQVMSLDYTALVPAIFVNVIVGSYADYLGRKYLVLVPLVTYFLKALVFLLVIYLSLDVDYLYLAYALDGISGAAYGLLLGTSASIADVTTTSQQRVLFLALVDVAIAVSGAVSQLGMGYLIEAVGFTIPACLICCLLFFGCVCVLVFMPETLRKPEHIVLHPAVHLRKVFGFYLFDGSVLQRVLFWCVLLVFFFFRAVILGRTAVETLYVMNSPFCWDSVKIGIFLGMRICLPNLTGIMSLKLLSRWLSLELIGLLSLTSGVVSYIVEALAISDLTIYMCVIASLMYTLVTPISRTLLSRMVPAKRQGAVFSSVSAIETVCHLTSTTVYNQVYMATLSSFPGAVFLLMAAFLLLGFLLLGFFTIVSRKYSKALCFTDVSRPSSSSPPSSSEDDDETQPLLKHQHNGAAQRQNTAVEGEGGTESVL